MREINPELDGEEEPWMRKLLLDVAYAIRRPDIVKPGANRGDGEFIWLEDGFIIVTTDGRPDWASRTDWSRPPSDGPGPDPGLF